MYSISAVLYLDAAGGSFMLCADQLASGMLYTGSWGSETFSMQEVILGELITSLRMTPDGKMFLGGACGTVAVRGFLGYDMEAWFKYQGHDS